MQGNVWILLAVAGGALLLMGLLAFLSQRYSLDGIKAKTVGDGQYGTARWATEKEIKKTYAHVPFRVMKLPDFSFSASAAASASS